MTENNRRQAMLPKGAVVFENPHGTAPGFAALRAGGKFIACMPGVPREMKPMLDGLVIPWLRARYGLSGGIFTRTLHTVGIGESELDRRVEDLFRTLENPKIAMLAHEGRVDVKIMAKAAGEDAARALIAPVEEAVRERIGNGIFGVDDETLEGAIVRELAARGLSLGTAESLTGGGLADAIVRVPGASAVFLGGIVAYDNAVKTALLGVDAGLLAAHGAVSAEVAQAMAEGARARLATSIGLATTGVAGPSGGSAEKPVGLVYFGLATPDGTFVRRATFPGTRADIRQRAVTAALNLLWRRLEAGETAAAPVSSPSR
jgi:nicotinamide-nucleotide amidase